MLSLQSVNLAVRLNPLYGTAAWHIQTCVLWMTVRGNWLSVQVQSEGRKSRGVPAAYLYNCRSVSYLVSIDKTSLSESQQRTIFGVHDRRRGEARISAYRAHREPFGAAGRMRLAGTTPEPSSTE